MSATQPLSRVTERGFIIALAVAVALVLARSAVFFIWEHAGFDSDQAIFGLMAKHISEGRAFPMFIYGDRYLLAVQAWLAAPLFAIFGPSIPVLKVPVLFVNVATACLLLWVLHRDAGLRPATALLASLFYVMAPPGLAGSLIETGGGNPEPFLYVLLLWILRGRPLAFGIVFGIGFIHREFTVYGVTAIVALAVLDDWRITPEKLRAVVLAAIGYLLVWQIVRAGFLFSTPFGPGATITAPLGGGDNIAGLASRSCWAPESIVPGLGDLFGRFFGTAFGADDHRLSDFGVRSLLRSRLPGLPAIWPVLGTVFAFALARVAWLSIRDRNPIWRGPGAVATFLLLVGLQAGVAYTVARCGQLSIMTFRYALLMLYLGVGVVALFFVYEPKRVWRRSMAAVMVVWALWIGTGHVQLMSEYIFREPPHPRRELVDYLVSHGIRYARAEYWTAYSTTFLSNEQVIVASTGVVRISGYQSEVQKHDTEAVSIQGEPCASSGGSDLIAGIYWVCPR